MPLPASLTRKAGPLKVWQWGAIAGVGAVGIVWWKKKHQSTAATTPSGVTPQSVPNYGPPFDTGIPDAGGGAGGGSGGGSTGGGGTGIGDTGGTGGIPVTTTSQPITSISGTPLKGGFISAALNPNTVASGLPPDLTHTSYTTAGGGGWITGSDATAIMQNSPGAGSPPGTLSSDAIGLYLSQHPTPTTSASAVQSAPAVTAVPNTIHEAIR